MASIIGISAFYHDSAAVLIVEGEIVAAVQEERFTRKKHDPSYPHNSINYVLSQAEGADRRSGVETGCSAAASRLRVLPCREREDTRTGSRDGESLGGDFA